MCFSATTWERPSLSLRQEGTIGTGVQGGLDLQFRAQVPPEGWQPGGGSSPGKAEAGGSECSRRTHPQGLWWSLGGLSWVRDRSTLISPVPLHLRLRSPRATTLCRWHWHACTPVPSLQRPAPAMGASPCPFPPAANLWLYACDSRSKPLAYPTSVHRARHQQQESPPFS